MHSKAQLNSSRFIQFDFQMEKFEPGPLIS